MIAFVIKLWSLNWLEEHQLYNVYWRDKIFIADLNEKEGVKIKITCKKSKRFLCEINYDEIIKVIEKYDIALEIPLELTIPCRACHESEIYRIYKDHYVFIKNKNKENWQSKNYMLLLYRGSAV